MQMRILSRHRDLERPQAVFARNSGWPVVPHALHKISDFGNVGVGKPCEEMVGKNLSAAVRGQER
jgi:hypothetical protein